MKATKDQAADRFSIVSARLDTMPMSEQQRSQVLANLRTGERIGELTLLAQAELRAIAGHVERAAISLVNSIKTMVARPVNR